MPSAFLIRLILAICALLLSMPAMADDRAKAAEHFALAESAERRKDWSTAIREYQAAYDLAPHPSVTYNIALNHERLGANKDAALAFLRYLDESQDADDRDQVLARVKGLREAPSSVTVESLQPEVKVIVDGVDKGPAPLTLELSGGQHSIRGERQGQVGPEHSVLLEYGAPASLTLDLSLKPGILSVHSKRRGVEIWLGGNLLGHTPFHGKVPAGDHTLVLRSPGYLDQERSVSIPSKGSAQVRVALQPDPQVQGAAKDNEASTKPARKNGFFGGLGYGIHGGAYRFTAELGASLLKSRLDLSLSYGGYGETAGSGLGANARFFFTDQLARVYGRGSAILGSNADGDSTQAIEAGLGLAVSTRRRGARVQTLNYEYYLEAGVQFVPSSEASGDETSSGGSTLSFPFMLGIIFRGG